MRKWGAPNPDNCDEIWLRHPRIPMDISQAVSPPQFAKRFAVFLLCFGLVHNIALQFAALCGRCVCTGPGKVAPPGFACVFLLLLCLWSRAFAVPLPCLCRVFAVGYPVRAVSLPWFCRVVALLLQCLCRVFVVSCPVLTMSWPWSGAFVPWLCRVVAVFCNVFAVFLPCGCRAVAFAVTVSLL